MILWQCLTDQQSCWIQSTVKILRMSSNSVTNFCLISLSCLSHWNRPYIHENKHQGKKTNLQEHERNTPVCPWNELTQKWHIYDSGIEHLHCVKDIANIKLKLIQVSPMWAGSSCEEPDSLNHLQQQEPTMILNLYREWLEETKRIPAPILNYFLLKENIHP